MTKKLDLHIEDLEDRIAPALVLPNDMLIFSGFDNPAPGDFHPALTARADAAHEATDGYNGPNFNGGGNEGPWGATAPFGGPLGFSPG